MSCLIFFLFSFEKSLRFMLIKKVGGRGRSSWYIGKERQRGSVSNSFFAVYGLIDH